MSPPHTLARRDADANQIRLATVALRDPQPLVADELGARVAQSQALAELGELAAHAEEPDGLLRVAVHLVARGLDAENVAVLERDGDAHLRVRASTQRELVDARVAAGGLALDSLESGAPSVADACAAEESICPAACGATCGACVPIRGGGHPLGVLCACARPGRPFDAAEIQFLQIAGNVVGGHLGRHAALADMQALQARLALVDRIVASATVAAGLAHEINNPLSVVTANLAWIDEALHDGGTDRPFPREVRHELSEALSDARRGADKIRDLVRDLRALHRVDEHDLAAVPLGPLITACSRIASAELAGRAHLVIDVDGAPPVHGNEARLGQVFLNLLVNAAHAIPLGEPESNEVRVTARAQGEWVVVDVRDTGRGIPPDRLPRLFEPFFTSASAAASAGPGRGRGLGLPICHQIVSSVGGTIEALSTPGAGSTLRVRLRVAPGDAPPGNLARR